MLQHGEYHKSFPIGSESACNIVLAIVLWSISGVELNWIEFNTFKRRRLQIDQRRHTTNK